MWLALSATAWSADQGEEELEAVVVQGQRIRDAQATKDDIPVLENPQALSVVSAEEILSRGITRLPDALASVAGVSRSSTYGYYDAYQIRGYDAAYGSVYLDGLLSANVAGTNNELSGVEQVEVLKGPASMLFGQAPLGGIVNLVSKRPRRDPMLDVTLSTGSYGLFEAAVDANHALDADGTLLGRLTFLYRDGDDFVDHAAKNRIFVAPALTWNIAERTKLTLLTRYERNHDNPWGPTSAWGTVLPSVHGELPNDFSISGRGDQRAIHNQWYKQAGYVFEHAFSDALSFNQTLRYSDRRVFWNNWIFASGFVDSEIIDGVQQGHILGRYIYGPFRQFDKDFGVDNRMKLSVTTGTVEHGFLFGVDYRDNKNRYGELGGNYDPAANPLDILNPDPDFVLVHDPETAYSAEGKSKQTGFYLQDHLRFGEAFTLTLGGRWDSANTDGAKDEKFSPRAGATWRVREGTSVYANWSRSFTPQAWAFTFEGDALPPETGENLEMGIKTASPDGKLNGGVAVFELTRQNIATDDPEHEFFYVLTGEQRSRGVEVESSWQPKPGLGFTVAYTYLDAVVTRDNLFEVGARLPNVPKHNLYLRGYATVPSGPFAKLGLQAGFLYNSRKNATIWPEDLDFDGEVDALSLFKLPSYSLVDVGLSYPLLDAVLRVNVNNLFDKRYFPDACCVDRVTPGEGRSWRASVSKSF